MGIKGPEAFLESAIRSLDAGEVPAAQEAIGGIGQWIRRGHTGESLYPAMVRVWDRFVSLLRRRGFFVDTPEDLELSLAEIRSLDEGFDLNDLARALASCDEAASGSRAVLTSPFFPLLSRYFGPGTQRSSSESTVEF